MSDKPKCDTPEKCRIQPGMSSTTCMYYQPIYDGYGNNLNPDMNTTTTAMKCHACGKEWVEQTRGQYAHFPSIPGLRVDPVTGNIGTGGES